MNETKNLISLEFHYKPHCDDILEEFGIPEATIDDFMIRIFDKFKSVSKLLSTENTGDILFFCLRTGLLSIADVLALDTICLNMFLSDKYKIEDIYHDR